MRFLVALAIAGIFVFLCRKPLKSYPIEFYFAAAVLAAVASLGPSSIGLDSEIVVYFWGLFQRGTLAQALFAIVMFTGALKNGSKTMKTLMPIRGELSILATILIFGHYIYFGKTYYLFLFTDPSAMPVNYLISMVISLVELAILIPLFITSFPPVRKKMGAVKWKNLQKLAYGFYGLTFIHIMLLKIPGLINGQSQNIISVAAYTAAFGIYAVLRIGKAIKSK